MLKKADSVDDELNARRFSNAELLLSKHSFYSQMNVALCQL